MESRPPVAIVAMFSDWRKLEIREERHPPISSCAHNRDWNLLFHGVPMSTRCEIFWEYWTEVLKSSCRLDFSFFFFFFWLRRYGSAFVFAKGRKEKKRKEKKENVSSERLTFEYEWMSSRVLEKLYFLLGGGGWKLFALLASSKLKIARDGVGKTLFSWVKIKQMLDFESTRSSRRFNRPISYNSIEISIDIFINIWSGWFQILKHPILYNWNCTPRNF